MSEDEARYPLSGNDQISPDTFEPSKGQKRGLKEGAGVKVTVGNQSIQGQLHLDKRVALNTVVLPLGFEETIPVRELGVNLLNGILVELTEF